MYHTGLSVQIIAILLLVFPCNSDAKTQKANTIRGQWVVLAGLESTGPSAGRASWAWDKVIGRKIILLKDVVTSPFSNGKCKLPSFKANAVDALSYYRDNKTSFESIGIHKNKVEETDIGCDKDTWFILSIIPIKKNVIVAGLQDGGYAIAVKDDAKLSNVTATKADCDILAGKAAKVTSPKDGKLKSAGCWNAGPYAVYAVTYGKAKGLPYTTLIYKAHGLSQVHILNIRNSIANFEVCNNLPSRKENKKSNGLTAVFSWVKGLDCVSSYQSRTGPMHASVVWLDSTGYRIFGFNWKYHGVRHFLTVLTVK